ncbi:MAG: flagellar basal body P-ring protein FlgI [Planctomycetaceae bacterium]|nr:flagellar basal body P-ring protein FlgI [Planctomycetaceae bacterium]
MTHPSQRLCGLFLMLGILVLAGCQDMKLFRSQSPDDEKEDDALIRVDREERAANKRSLVKDYTSISGNKMVVLEGVGLVTKLDGTGGDSPATNDRKELMDEMRRLQIENPNEVLRSPYTALVIVRAYLPALVEKGEKFDVYSVRLPDGSEATSLAGGWLMRCDLWEKQIMPGRGPMTGKRLARAEGPILISADVSKEEAGSAGLMRGSIPGGAVCLREEKPLSIHLRSDYRSVRMANRITSRIGERFHDYDEYGIRRPLARFRADSRIDLEVHPRYKITIPDI